MCTSERAPRILTLVLGVAIALAMMVGVSHAKPLSIARQGYFFVGGHYVKAPTNLSVNSEVAPDNGMIMDGQMFVQFQIPARQRHPYPIVMIHGHGQSGINFLGTPDGRPGWADFFLRRGYAVYVVDQVFRGRSAYHADLDGLLRPFSVTRTEQVFTHPEGHRAWPEAKSHSQWPGEGVRGDEAFDQFYAGQLDSSADNSKVDESNADAGVALLEKIGPAILLTHSRAGAYGWLIADRKPALVKAIMAVEPWGPPFGAESGKGAIVRPWGLSTARLTYAPVVSDPRDLAPTPPLNGQVCWGVSVKGRVLVNLMHIPITIITSEASSHAQYDQCTSKFLSQMGVTNTWVELSKHGLHGNGHMMMLERNSDEIADLIEQQVRAIR